MSLKDLARVVLEHGIDSVSVAHFRETRHGRLGFRYEYNGTKLYEITAANFVAIAFVFQDLRNRLEDPVLCLAMTMDHE